MMHFSWYRFSELSNHDLYAILVLRSKVFVVEQNCVYLDPDEKDPQALHLLGIEKNSLSCYLRLFPPLSHHSVITFGRLLTEQSKRRKGYANKLMDELLSYCGTNYPGIGIKCAAQLYLAPFYEKFGFKTHGEIYDEEGILHVEMRRKD